MATALPSQNTMDFKKMALQCQQLKANDGTAVDITDLIGLAGGGAGASITVNDVTGGDASLAVTGQAAAQGGAIAVTGGASSTSTNAGGAVAIAGGVGTTTSVGGAVSLTGGLGVGASAGGASTVAGGLGGATNAVGGVATVRGGAGQGTGAGAAAAVVGGASGAGATGNGGNVTVTGGAAASTNGNGGDVILSGGALAGSGMEGSTISRGKVLARRQATPTAKTVTSAITAAELMTKIITTTGVSAPSIHQLPTGTLLLAQVPGFAANDSFDFTIINTGTGASDDATITVNTDVTIVGNPTAGSLTDATIISGSATFRARYVSGVTWVVYRIS